MISNLWNYSKILKYCFRRVNTFILIEMYSNIMEFLMYERLIVISFIKLKSSKTEYRAENIPIIEL